MLTWLQKIIVVGAGLGGLGAAIALQLAGHHAIVLEAAPALGEVGAGIQLLPNSSKILRGWGVLDKVHPSKICETDACNILDWRGHLISSMNMESASREYGSPFHDLHRADLHKALYDRAIELGAEVHVGCEVTGIKFDSANRGAIVSTKSSTQPEWKADLVVGADGLHSQCRRLISGKEEVPRHTGDMAYRLLLDADEVRSDPEMGPILDEKAVTYWYGPGAHVGRYTGLGYVLPHFQ